jgi:hypothetical protein
VAYIYVKICAQDVDCQQQALSLASADYVDADYDSISHSLVLRAFWSRSGADDGKWHGMHRKGERDTVEVGILMNEKPSELEELKYSGVLTVIGQDKKPCKPPNRLYQPR